MHDSHKVVDTFQEAVQNALGHFQELVDAIDTRPRNAALKSMLAEQCAMSLATLWEAFIHELLLTYAAASPKRYFDNTKTRIRQSVSSNFAGATLYVKFDFPKRPTKELLSKIIDPKGWNIAINSSDALATRANSLLSAAKARKFNIPHDDRVVVDFLIALRNFLAHRSKKSRLELSGRVATILPSGVNSLLSGSIGSIGAYLKTSSASGKTRAEIVGSRLIEISEKMR
jgi:hypothetical protein